MRRRLVCLALTASLGVLACEPREITVFDLPMPGGSSGSGGEAGTAGSETAGSTALAAGSDSGGAAGDAGLLSAGSGGMASSSGGSAGSGGGGGMPPGMPCGMDTDCAPGWKCEKPGCQVALGVCTPQQVFCPPDPQPVCGCDGVTYWNDCIRRQAGAVVDTIGECQATACACEVGADCEVPFASCSHLVLGDMCGHGMGSCWVLPPQCTPSNDSKMWKECKPPDAGAPPAPCVDTCLAIASEHPHVQLHHGDTCQ